MLEGARELSGISIIRELIPLLRALSAITSPKPYFLILSYEDKFQYMNLEGAQAFSLWYLVFFIFLSIVYFWRYSFLYPFFLKIAEWYSIIYMYHRLFTHLPTGWHIIPFFSFLFLFFFLDDYELKVWLLCAHKFLISWVNISENDYWII